ncbi:PDZ domain-containing protein [Propionispora vibrioides]|uniref:PDZ domain (Also known as DHR or GLGF) n=1 Tax=Propionispora vibrioides TaxID=112903 RepID=A0A1H8XSN1_9FIRM|nr:PDZ domain-containing protein [Propionispora vibrioides]SEP42905.1 PDZ domain (Also known as DHR or GLGF) [Propionispora vibrioides]
MKCRALCLITVFLLMIFSVCSAATDINPRSGDSKLVSAVAQQGEAKINFVRSFKGHMYIELQHVTRGAEDYAVLHIQGWDGTKDFDNVEIKTAVGQEISLQAADVKPAVYLPSDYIDKWYNINLKDWERISADKKVVCVMHRKDGKSYEVKIDDLLSYVNSVSESAKDLPVSYGPQYSVFFPGKAYKEVRDTFAYHINERGKNNKAVAINGFWRYAVDENSRAIGFSYDYSPQHINYVKFIEMPEGTWLNLDHWTGPPLYDSYYEWKDRTAIDDATRKIYQTYVALEPWGDYGISLQGSPLKTPLIVDRVNLKLHPELDGLKPGDQIIAVNGKDTKDFLRYEMDYLMWYSKDHPDLRLTVQNKTQGTFEITAKAHISNPLVDNVDYEAINKKEDYLWYKKRTPLAYTPNFYAPYEIFDPYGPQNVPLVSPRTMFLIE